ncbi:MAG: hypothetical protein NTY38_03815, partial [Acidobacteria bacterium]|nr:hypothetical protein [Acidobacteriota bacterium]
MSLIRWTVAYACLHGLLYVSLLPLWEGYDEPYHYGYVRQLAARFEIPNLKHSSLSAEIWQSMLLAPTSYLNARNAPVF